MDIKYMKIALELAKLGEGRVNPNPMVGAIVVKDGEIVGKGYHKEYGGPHAEVFALEEAGIKAEGATIYVTLEPCSHYGKTPPCAKKIVESKIKRCVIATTDPNELVSGKGIEILEKAGVKIELGVLEEESKKLNAVFMKYITKQEPYIFVKFAISLDGKIATRTGDSKWISNEQSRLYVQSLRNKFMGIMIGVNTVINDDPKLNSRIEGGLDPYRIIIDPNLKTPIDSKIIRKNLDKKTIIITSFSNKNNIEKYYEFGVDFIFIEGKKFKMKEILKKLTDLNIDSVLVEGGSSLISDCIKEKLIDEGIIFIAPKILGDDKAISFVKGLNIEKMKDSIKLKNSRYEIFGDSIGLIFEGVE